MNKQKMTTAQALVKFLNQQYIDVDGEQYPFIQGVFTILAMVMLWV